MAVSAASKERLGAQSGKITQSAIVRAIGDPEPGRPDKRVFAESVEIARKAPALCSNNIFPQILGKVTKRPGAEEDRKETACLTLRRHRRAKLV